MEKKKSAIPPIDLKEMGKRVREQREASHLTRGELADKIGVTAKFVADIEYGGKGVSIQNLYRLSKALNVSADYILEGDRDIPGGRNPEAERIKENILAPLSTCNNEQLKCMEQIARYYVEAIVGKE